MSTVGLLYDHLFGFESKKKRDPFPVHKRLKLEKGKGLLGFLESKIQFNADDHILDAGCGNGYVLFRLNDKYNCAGVGISLSQKEVQFAVLQAARSGLHMLSFLERSYDREFCDRFSKILAIESLKHSENLGQSMGNLVRSLKEGGTLIVADDYIVNLTEDISKQKAYWKSAGFSTQKEFEKHIESVNGIISESYDLTYAVPSRPKVVLNFLVMLSSWIYALFKGTVYRTNILTYRGGLLLEKAYTQGDVKYMVHIVVRND